MVQITDILIEKEMRENFNNFFDRDNSTASDFEFVLVCPHKLIEFNEPNCKLPSMCEVCGHISYPDKFGLVIARVIGDEKLNQEIQDRIIKDSREKFKEK